MMLRRLHILACAKAGSCALGPFSVGYTMSISGHLRALTEFLRTTAVLMTPRNTYAIGRQLCESMACKFPPTSREKLAHGERARWLPPLHNLRSICGTNGYSDPGGDQQAAVFDDG